MKNEITNYECSQRERELLEMAPPKPYGSMAVVVGIVMAFAAGAIAMGWLIAKLIEALI